MNMLPLFGRISTRTGTRRRSRSCAAQAGGAYTYTHGDIAVLETRSISDRRGYCSSESTSRNRSSRTCSSTSSPPPHSYYPKPRLTRAYHASSTNSTRHRSFTSGSGDGDGNKGVLDANLTRKTGEPEHEDPALRVRGNRNEPGSDGISTGTGTTRNTLRMIMFGKPGAGKGTLTSRLTTHYPLTPLSTGDLLRAHILSRTPIGTLADHLVASGRLLPDHLMLDVVTSKLQAMTREEHWILDGFPRTVGQGEMLDGYLSKQGTPLTLVINLDVDDDIILRRISDRWVHPGSGRIYNLTYNPPKVPGKDDVTGEPLVRRPDDNPEIFAHRLREFYKSTSPLLEYYASQSSSGARLVTLTGRTTDEVWPNLERIVRGYFGGASVSGKQGNLDERVPVEEVKRTSEEVKRGSADAEVEVGKVIKETR